MELNDAAWKNYNDVIEDAFVYQIFTSSRENLDTKA